MNAKFKRDILYSRLKSSRAQSHEVTSNPIYSKLLDRTAEFISWWKFATIVSLFFGKIALIGYHSFVLFNGPLGLLPHPAPIKILWLSLSMATNSLLLWMTSKRGFCLRSSTSFCIQAFTTIFLDPYITPQHLVIFHIFFIAWISSSWLSKLENWSFEFLFPCLDEDFTIEENYVDALSLN